MLKDKKGLSAIVMTIIMIGLVLVAVGIVWAVVSGIIEQQAESLDYDQDCLGINLDIKNLQCNAENCSFVIDRRTGSTGSPISGIAVTFSSASESSPSERELVGNIAATLTKSNIPHGINTVPIRADARIYLEKEDGTNHYCSQIASGEVSS